MKNSIVDSNAAEINASMEGFENCQMEEGPNDSNDETSEEREDKNDQNADHQDESGFKCTKCDLRFRKRSFLLFHITTHTARKQYECERCEKKYKTLPELKKHKLSHKEQPSTYCKHCRKTFSSRSNLARHIRNMHVSQPTFVCSVCALYLPSEAKLKLHQSVHEGVVGCDKCDKVIKISDSGIKVAKYLMNRHQLSHKEKQFKCDGCSATFARRDVLKKHVLRCLKINEKERPFPCDACYASFTRKDVLKRHVKRCHNKRDDVNFEKRAFPCKKCNARFSYSEGLRNHVVRCHINQEAAPNEKDIDNSKASSNDNKSSSISELDINNNNDDTSNSNTTIYKCQHCMETFSKENCLKTHEATHTSTKSFKCDVSSKFLSKKSNLKCQVLVHDKKKKPEFTCKICQTKFEKLIILLSHWSKVHMNTKQKFCADDGTSNSNTTIYKCQHCMETFSKENCLRTHEATHTSTKSFKCDVGSKFLSKKSNLKCQVLVHDKKKKPEFTCKICQTKFENLSILLSHWSKMHINTKRSAEK